MLLSTLRGWLPQNSNHNDTPYSIDEFAELYEKQGRTDAAQVFHELSERRQSIMARLTNLGIPAPESTLVPPLVLVGLTDWVMASKMFRPPYRGLRILRNGALAVLAMLFLSLLAFAINPVLTVAVLLLTATVLFVFLYAFWVETSIPFLNPYVMFYCILITISLAILTLTGIFLR